MKAAIVPIGNSKGIRLPKAVLMECGLTDQVELQVRDGQLVIRSLHHPRSGWEEAYAEMHKSGEDALLDADSHNASDWDRQAWRW